MPEPKSNRGGQRIGAGRKPGAINRATAAAREKAEATGITPLEFMLQVMRDEGAERSERLDMAKAAAPYIHARLSTVESNVTANLTASVNEIRRTVVDPRNTDA